MTRSCATCKFFAETVDNPVPASRGECRWKPKPEPVSRDHWCGEFRVMTAAGKDCEHEF